MSDSERNREVVDLLFEQGRFSADEVETVRRLEAKLDHPQHVIIVDHALASEEDTWRALAEVHGIEFVDLCNLELPDELLEAVPVKAMLDHRLIPVDREESRLTLAFAEPPRQSELSNLRLMLNAQIQAVLATPSCIRSVIKERFGLGAETIQRLRDDGGPVDRSAEMVFDVTTGEDQSDVEATIGKFVDQLLSEALRVQATDIHLEPYLSKIKMRYRIDGILEPVPVPTGLREVYAALVSRLKIMAGLNIAEKRIPQDGRISTKTATEEYDLRVSVIPIKHGEAVCLRILGRRSLSLDLNSLGLASPQAALVRDLTKLPQGLVLITGPTGSGKTTTLYAALAHAYDEGRKIITIEDPVEYQLDGVLQIQTRDEVGLTFAGGLRSVLRHDPDVVLIGEVRDDETAEIAVRAAQTGHLVFSTLHTNDSISAMTRLLDMRVDPFLIGSSLVCSVAQRLAQRICRHCLEPDDTLSDSLRQEMASALNIKPSEARAFRGRGCVECGEKGRRGRVALYEFFVMNDEIADMLGPSIKTGQLREAARRAGWKPLREFGWQKVQQGDIPLAELQRLTRRIDHPLITQRGRSDK